MPREPIDTDARTNEFALASQRYMAGEQVSQTLPSTLDKLEKLFDNEKCSDNSKKHIPDS